MRRFLLVPLLLAVAVPAVWAADTADTPKAAATRKKLTQKVTVDYKDTLLRDVMDDLKEQAGVTFLPDTKGGVNLNSKVTFKAKDAPLEEVLNGICDKIDIGYYVISNKTNGYDGSFRITRGKERGYEAGKEPDKTAEKPDKEKPDATKPPDKEKPTGTKPPDKEKPDATKPPDKEKPPETKPDDDPEQVEKDAARHLKFAKELLDAGKTDKGRERLAEVVKKYPNTKAAEEAKKLLESENNKNEQDR